MVNMKIFVFIEKILFLNFITFICSFIYRLFFKLYKLLNFFTIEKSFLKWYTSFLKRKEK